MKIKCNGTLEIEAGAIKITAQRDVDIQARGATNIDSTQNVNIGSDADVKVNALNIVNTARVGFVGKGTASSELSAGGQTTVKGAMVMIN